MDFNQIEELSTTVCLASIIMVNDLRSIKANKLRTIKNFRGRTKQNLQQQQQIITTPYYPQISNQYERINVSFLSQEPAI